MLNQTIFLLGAMVALGNSSLLSGAVIFDNGAPTSGSGPTITLLNLSDDFTLSSPTTLRGLRFYGSFDNDNPADHQGIINFWILSDSGGSLAIAAQGTDTGVELVSPISISGVTLYQFLVNLGDIALSAGDYRIVVKSPSSQALTRWNFTSPGSGSRSSFIFFDPGGIDSNVLSGELNFQLLDEPGDAIAASTTGTTTGGGSAVPEPSTLAMALLVAAVGIPIGCRRSR